MINSPLKKHIMLQMGIQLQLTEMDFHVTLKPLSSDTAPANTMRW